MMGENLKDWREREHTEALIARLKKCKAGETYPLDPYERYLLLQEIDRLGKP